MARALLTWQQDALNAYETAGTSGRPPMRFLLAAFPGMGKTEAAAAILARTGRFGIVLVAQVDTLGTWRSTLHGRGVCVAAKVSKDAVSNTCACGKPAKAVVMTYDFAAANPSVLASLFSKRGPCLLICDEVHHLRSDRAWAAPIIAVRPYVDAALVLSATPFRTDEEPVPFVHTEGPWTREISLLPERCVVEHLYKDALTMKPAPVTRGVFERYDADVRWLESDGTAEAEVAAVLSQEKRHDVARKARRHALNLKGDWLPRVLRDADNTLERIRITDHRGGGLIICLDTDHAVATADRLVETTQGPVTVYTQEYSTQSHRLGAGCRQCAGCDTPFDRAKTDGRNCCPACGDVEYKRPGNDSGDVRDAYDKGDSKWIVTVRKVSEGVDIQRLRVLIYATVTRTRLFFIQALGRVIRIRRDLPKDVDQTAWVYIPDDESMQEFAREVEDDIADAEIAAYDDDQDETTRCFDDQERRESSYSERFISANPEYAGSIAGGTSHDPELMALAVKLGEPPYETLRMLRKLRESGHLNLTGVPAPVETAQQQLFDPVAELKTATLQKDAAVKSWVGLWLRKRADLTFTDAIKLCHNELDDLFGVGSWRKDVTIDQVKKATAYARERIKDLRSG